jgi:hypothetical protein
LIDASGVRRTALAGWLSDVGVISFALAIGGMVVGLLRRATRLTVIPLVGLVFADLAIPVSRVNVLTPDAFATLRLLAVVALAVAAGLAVQAASLALIGARIPFAEPASVLLVVFNFTLVFVGAEDSAFAADRRGDAAAQIWTDEALGRLPANGLLLLRSEALAWRFFAARVVRGERPDVVLVPTSLLERGPVRARLLNEEPALLPLIREMALTGKASEYALSTLADARPLFVEVDPTWDHCLLEHLIPEPFFMHFAPEPLGRSDRDAGLERGESAFVRVLTASDDEGRRDEATRSVLLAEIRERALVSAALGDRKNLETVLTTARTIDPNDSVADELAARVKGKPRGELSLAGLMR